MFEEVDWLAEKKVIGIKCVLCVKIDPKGELDKHKARVMAKGSNVDKFIGLVNGVLIRDATCPFYGYRRVWRTYTCP